MYTTRAEMLAQIDRVAGLARDNHLERFTAQLAIFRELVIAYPDTDQQIHTHVGFPYVAAAALYMEQRIQDFLAHRVTQDELQQEMNQMIAALVTTMQKSNNLMQRLNGESRDRQAIIGEFAQEDHRLKLAIKNNRKQLTLQEIVEINRKLEHVLQTGFRASAPAAPAGSTNAEDGLFGKKFLAAVSKLFKSLADPSKNKDNVMQSFMGSILALVFAFIGKLFKGFSGPGSSAQIDELVTDAEKAFKVMSFNERAPVLMSGGPRAQAQAPAAPVSAPAAPAAALASAPAPGMAAPLQAPQLRRARSA